MKRYTPNLLIKYLIKEFSLSLIIFTIIFSSLIIFITYIDEILFFKDKEITDNFFIKTLILSLIKSPTLIINLVTLYIFIFRNIFLCKILRNNEITPMSLSGFSKKFYNTSTWNLLAYFRNTNCTNIIPDHIRIIKIL